MSRIGRSPVPVPDGVKATIDDATVVTVTGPKGTLQITLTGGITARLDEGAIVIERPGNNRKFRSLHGLYRALVNNAVIGVTKGYEIGLEVVGTGYRVEQKGNALRLNVGYSHPVEIVIPEGITVRFDEKNRNRFYVRGIDKQYVGQYAATIRSIRPPMRYKAKGIKYVSEPWRLKAGKAAAK